MIISGSVYNSLKMMKLNIQWQQRKENPNLPKKDEDPQMQMLRRSAEDVRKSNITASLDGKLKAGLELTNEELAYLKENNPQMYQEAMEIRRERKAYEKQLKSCKTKEDVDRLNTQKLQSFMAQVKSIKGSNLSRGEKKAQLEKILKRMMAIQNEHQRFTRSIQYQQLPEEEEVKKARKKEKKSQSSGGEEVDQKVLPSKEFFLQLENLFAEEGFSMDREGERESVTYSSKGEVEPVSTPKENPKDLGGKISVKA